MPRSSYSTNGRQAFFKKDALMLVAVSWLTASSSFIVWELYGRASCPGNVIAHDQRKIERDKREGLCFFLLFLSTGCL